MVGKDSDFDLPAVNIERWKPPQSSGRSRTAPGLRRRQNPTIQTLDTLLDAVLSDPRGVYAAM